MPSPSFLDRLGHAFRQPELIAQALTHRSHGATHNERLEFVGDAVLNCVVAAVLFERFPAIPEGELTRVRASLVNRDTLARLARGLALGGEIVLGEGEVQERRGRAAVDPRRCARGDLRRRFRRCRLRRRAERDRARLCGRVRRPRPGGARQGPEDAAAGMAAGAPHRRAGIRGDRDRRRSARADVHDRMPRTGARRRRYGHRLESPRGGAGRCRATRSRAWWPHPAMRVVADAPQCRGFSLRLRRDRRPAECRQVDAAQSCSSAQSVSITSKKAQTTRHRVTGIVTTDESQIVFVDTPGFQTKHRSRLNDRMNRAVTQCLADVDAVRGRDRGRTHHRCRPRGDSPLARETPRALVALNKIDRVKERTRCCRRWPSSPRSSRSRRSFR